MKILGDAKQFGHELDKAAGKTRRRGKVAGAAGGNEQAGVSERPRVNIRRLAHLDHKHGLIPFEPDFDYAKRPACA